VIPQNFGMIAGAIVAIVVLSQVVQMLLGAYMKRTSGNNSRKGLTDTEHQILLHMTEFKLIQERIVERLQTIVCDQQDLTKAVQKLAEHCERIAATIQN